MKNLVLMLALVSTITGQAQLSKGRFMLGGAFGYGSSKYSTFDTLNGNGYNDHQNQKNYSVYVRCGTFITDHIMVGIFGAYQNNYDMTDHVYTTNPYFSRNTKASNAFSGGLFARYYKMLGKSRFAVFGELDLSYGKNKTTGDNVNSIQSLIHTSSVNDVISIGANVRPGLAYFVTPKIALETSLGSVGYSYQKTNEYTNSQKTAEITSIGFYTPLSFSLPSWSFGINFYFGGATIPKKETHKE